MELEAAVSALRRPDMASPTFAAAQEEAAQQILEALQRRDTEIERLQRAAAHQQRQIALLGRERQCALDDKEAVVVQFQYALRDLEDREAKLDALRAELEQLRGARAAAEGNLSATEERSRGAAEQLAATQDEVRRLGSVVQEQQARVVALEKDLISARADAERHRADRDRVATDFDAVSGELARLHTAATEHGETTQAAISTLQCRAERAEAALATKEAIEQDLREDVEHLEAQLRELQKSTDALAKSRLVEQQLAQRVESLELAEAAQRTRADSHARELQACRAEHDAVAAKLDDYVVANAEFEQRFTTMIDKEAAQQRALERLTADHNAATSSVEELVAEKAVLTARVAELSAQLKRREARDGDLRTQHDEVSDRAQHLEDRCDALEEELERARAAAADAAAGREGAEAQLHGQLAVMAENQERHARAAAAHTEEIEAMARRIDEVRRRALVAESRVQQSEQLAALAEARARDLSDLRAEHTTRIDAIEGQRAAAEQHARHLEAKLANVRGDLADARSAGAAAESAQRVMEAEVAKVVAKCDRLQQQVAAKTAAVAALQDNVARLRRRAEAHEEAEQRCEQLAARLKDAEARAQLHRAVSTDAKRASARADEQQVELLQRAGRVSELEELLRAERRRNAASQDTMRDLLRRDKEVRAQLDAERTGRERALNELAHLRRAHQRVLELRDEAMNRITNDVLRALVDVSRRFHYAHSVVSAIRRSAAHALRQAHRMHQQLRRSQEEAKLLRERAAQAQQPAAARDQQRYQRAAELLSEAQRDAALRSECDALSRRLGAGDYSALLNSSAGSATSCTNDSRVHAAIGGDDDRTDVSADECAERDACEAVLGWGNGDRHDAAAAASLTSLVADECALNQRILAALGATGLKGGGGTAANGAGGTLYDLLRESFEFWLEGILCLSDRGA